MSSYFQSFNYSLANEDTRVERDSFTAAKKILAIAGSGARVLPLLRAQVEQMSVVDISAVQIAFVQFKYELMKCLDLDDYLKVLGYSSASADRRRHLCAQLRGEAKTFADKISDEQFKRGLIYSGRWESFLIKLSRTIRSLTATNFEKFFEARHLDEQRELYARYWPRRRLHLFLNLVAQERLINHFLYRGRMAHNSKESLTTFLERNFERAVNEKLLRESFFHQMLFLGELRYREGFPIEVDEKCFYESKDFCGEIRFIHSGAIDMMRSSSADAYSLSDIASYLDQVQVKELGEVIDEKKAITVIRTFLAHPQMGSASRPELALEALRKESTGLYEFQIFANL